MQIAIFLCATIALASYFCKKMPLKEGKKIFYAFLFAYILRIVLSFILYKAGIARGYEGFFLGLDDYYTGKLSIEIADHWRAYGLSLPSHFGVGITDVSLILHKNMAREIYDAGILFISNNSVALLLFVNCFFGAAGTFVLYKLSRIFFNEKISFLSACIFAVWPSIVFWSTVNLREAPVTFVILIVVLYAARVLRREKFSKNTIPDSIILLAALFLLYALLRPVAYLAAALFVFALFIRGLQLLRGGVKTAMKCLAAAALVIIIATPLLFSEKSAVIKAKNFLQTEIGTLGEALTDPVKALEISRKARIISAPGTPSYEKGEMTRGKSSIMPDLHIQSYADFFMFLPLSPIIGIFYPLPWQANSLMAFAAVPEMLLWYALLPFFLRGVYLSFRFKKKDIASILFVFLFFLLFIVLLAMRDGNAGALFRHRSMVMPLAFMFISAGFLHDYPFFHRK